MAKMPTQAEVSAVAKKIAHDIASEKMAHFEPGPILCVHFVEPLTLQSGAWPRLTAREWEKVSIREPFIVFKFKTAIPNVSVPLANVKFIEHG